MSVLQDDGCGFASEGNQNFVAKGIPHFVSGFQKNASCSPYIGAEAANALQGMLIGCAAGGAAKRLG
jgi:hypothetical protein